MGGGKTQQRVAGNAKPTNSGRIRGLLINQQVAPSSMITFSTLSNRNQQKPPSEIISNASTADSPKSTLTKTEINDTLSSTEETPVKTACKENTRLIVRRVGNRDFYTRVKYADGHDDYSTESATDPKCAGVKKPPYQFEDGECPNEDDTTQEKETDTDYEDNEADPGDGEKDLSDLDVDEECTFEGILDRLDEARALVEQREHVITLQQLDSEDVDVELKLVSIFKIMLKKFSFDLSIEEWDYILRSLNKWVGWINKSDHPLNEVHQAVLCTKVFNFIDLLFAMAEKAKGETEQTDNFPLMQSLLDDWGNFRSSNIFLDFIELYFKLIKSEPKSDQMIPSIRQMIEAVAQIIISVDPKMVLSHKRLLDYLTTKVEFDTELKSPQNSLFCSTDDKGFLAACNLLKSNTRVVIVTAHAILTKILDSICKQAQSKTLISEHDAVDDVLVFPPESLMAILTSRDSIMTALLSDFRVGDISVTIEPGTDSYGCTLSYLFAWDLAIQFIMGMEKEVGQCMIHSLKKLGLIQRLLDNIFILLPPLEARDSLNFKFESSSRTPSVSSESWSIKQFLKSPLQTTVKRPINEIELVALHLYFSVALHMPVTVRKWYNNNSNKRLCNLVNEYTVKHISQLICSLEMESVLEKCQERASKDVSNNLTIKARPSAKEVYAIYTRDEFKMELTIKLPQNYPLGPVQIDGGKRVGVTDVKWRSWLLQLTTFLAHQNGPILDGVDLWRKNIDKRFEGVEKCTICFSILHSNYQLPKKKCQTCANMFHNLCLYKWFESSGNSTCPLCRNPW